MKGFIELDIHGNMGKQLIAISSIALVEQQPNSRTKIVLKEKIDANSECNISIFVNTSYTKVKSLIIDSIEK